MISHEEATLTSWRLLIESMESMCRDGRGAIQKTMTFLNEKKTARRS